MSISSRSDVGTTHLLALISSSFLIGAASSCTSVECAKGTIERDGLCEIADDNTNNATCGPGTVLQGDKCVATSAPTKCDPATTQEQIDPVTGEVTCIGTSAGSCDTPIACPVGAAGKMTICGQMFQIEDDNRLAAASPTFKQCPAAGAATGPCALELSAVNAQGQAVLPNAGVVIDDCGRFRVSDIDYGTAAYIALIMDDRGTRGPSGTTVTSVGVVLAAAGASFPKLDLFTAKATTISTWATSIDEPMLLQGGIYLDIFRPSKTANTLAPGVTITRSGVPIPNDDYYWPANDLTRAGGLDPSPTVTVTGKNGSGISLRATLGPHGGSGGIPDTCAWDPIPGGNVPFTLIVQTRRPVDGCNL
jgi:hypothetical protein